MVSADYIVGLTDGEGCFYVNVRPPGVKRFNYRVETHFYLKLRSDEYPLLKKVKDFFGCGAIYFQKEKRSNHSPCYRYEINNREDVSQKLIPFFKKHPLQSKKRHDFEIFCRIVEIINRREHLTEEGLEEIRRLKSRMNIRARPVREIRSPVPMETSGCRPKRR